MPAELQANLEAFTASIDDLENLLDPILAESQLPESTVENSCKMNTAMAYSLYSLYYMLLRTKGMDTEDHQVKSELEKVKKYVEKVSKTLAPKPAAPTSRIDMASSVPQQHRNLNRSTPLPNTGHITWKKDVDKILNN